MKISSRIFLCYLVISGVCLYYPFDWVLDTMRTRYLEGVEDPLVDQANMLASAVELEMERGGFVPEKWYKTLERTYDRKVDAQIYKLNKDQVDIRIYITDENGTVVFNSHDDSAVGEDYSEWRDVMLTLQGMYGARTSRLSEGDNTSSVLYVAAPIMLDGQIAGVLTVGKPTTNITWFVENAKLQVVGIALLALCVSALLSYFVSRWVTGPIRKLTVYANAIAQGERPGFPQLGKSEIGEMGTAFEKMQQALEGKQYVEQYVQNLTHEIKSPLSAIRASAELLAEPMEDRQRARFLDNIRNESLRIQKVVDRMLELASLENRQKPAKTSPVNTAVLVRTVVESLETVMASKKIEAQIEDSPEIIMQGDAFLLHQALTNLLQNAIDFSPEGGSIRMKVEAEDATVRFIVEDEGTGIAEFARERIFEKFFSLQRPDTGQKSTGLGLNFVRQVALLHGGTARLDNRPSGGVQAVLELSVDSAARGS